MATPWPVRGARGCRAGHGAPLGLASRFWPTRTSNLRLQFARKCRIRSDASPLCRAVRRRADAPAAATSHTVRARASPAAARGSGSRRGSGLNRTRLFKPRPARRRPGPHPRPGRPAPPERVPCRGVCVVMSSPERNLLASAVRKPRRAAERAKDDAGSAAGTARGAGDADRRLPNRPLGVRTSPGAPRFRGRPPGAP